MQRAAAHHDAALEVAGANGTLLKKGSSNNNKSSPILFIGSVQSTAQTYVDINTVSTKLATTLMPAVSTYNNTYSKRANVSW